jgi:hypothetical protein
VTSGSSISSGSSGTTGSSTDTIFLGLTASSLAPVAEGIPARSSLPGTAISGAVAIVGFLVALAASSGGSAEQLASKISYSLTTNSSSGSSSANSSSAGLLQRNADSAVLNSRARHTVRVPSSGGISANDAEHSALQDAVCGSSNSMSNWSCAGAAAAVAAVAVAAALSAAVQPLYGAARCSELRQQCAVLVAVRYSSSQCTLQKLLQ